jgi:hypothetical protein
MMRWIRIVLTLALCLVPGAAFADGFFSVGIGASTGGFFSKTQRTYPWQLGFVSHNGWVGFDGEYGAIMTSGVGPNLRTLGASLRIGKRFSAWRPYGSVGWATLGTLGGFSDAIKITGDSVLSNSIITFGGGLMGELAKHVGLQVEVRVFHDLQGTPAANQIQFTRGAASVYIKF